LNTTAPVSDQLRDQAVVWLLRLQSENCTAEDLLTFEKWLSEHPSHRQAFDLVSGQWQWLERFKTTDFPARSAAVRYRPKPRLHLLGYSAAAAVVLTLALTAFSTDGWLGFPHTYTAQKGDHQIIVLADGSTVELNTDSKIEVLFNHWYRQVKLIKGEAFFTVKHNAERPFAVQTEQGMIRDIGTAFDVYVKSNEVIVAVEEGSVEIETTHKLELSAGQQLAFDRTGDFQPLREQDIASFTAWRHGRLVFHNRNLDEVLIELSRYHASRIYLRNPSFAKLKVSGTFHTTNLDNTLNAIATLFPVKISHPSKDEVVLQ